MTKMACRKCHRIVEGKICPVCKSSSLSDDWKGYVVIIDPENSRIAKMLKAVEPGEYALRVR
ncbi:MAG: DNA-directed RNA polymerase, subunit E'' [Hadesarchaea archaeon]|nr:DNA-directed RNA polymerase, subunit E'' [Hadesarchaea archaeon]